MAGLVALMQCNILLLHTTCTSNSSVQGMSYMVHKPCATACLHALNGKHCQLTGTKHAQHTIHICDAVVCPCASCQCIPSLGLIQLLRQTAVHSCSGPAQMQGTVIWRARLSSSDLPKGESHFFLRGSMIATFYPISSDQYVWTVGAPVSCLEEVGLSAKTGPTGPKADVKGKLDPPEGNRGEAQGHGQVAKGTAAKTGSADSQQETKDQLVATQAEQAQNGCYRQPVAKAAELSASEVCL